MRFTSLANRNFKEIYRDPVSSLLGLIMPIGLLILFSTIYNKSKVPQFSPEFLTPGIIVFSFAFLIMFSAILIAKDKQSSFLTRLFTTPLKASDFIASYIIPFIPLAIFQIFACLIVGVILGAQFDNIFLAMLVFLLVALACICTGVILGALFSVNQVSGIGSLLITAIGLFGGAWMDLNMVGGVFKTIGYAMPFAHAVDSTRNLLINNSTSVYNITIVAIYAIVLLLFAIYSFRRTMKKV